MSIPEEEIIQKSRRWILSRLTDRTPVDVPLVGRFTSRLLPEYILSGSEAGRVLYPPKIVLDFEADPFILDSDHYASYDFKPSESLYSREMASALSGLNEWDEQETKTALQGYLTRFFTNLFRGRRVSFMGLGDFYIAEEASHFLMLHFEPATGTLQALNHPFSAYDPITLPELPPAELGIEVYETVPASVPSIAFTVLDKPKQVPTDTETNAKEQVEKGPASILDEKIPKNISERKPPAPTQNHKPPYMIYGLVLAALLTGLLFLLFPKESREEAPLTEIVAEMPDTLHTKTEVSAAQASLPRDTIESGETLVKLARKYYGEKEYWVYLYFQNKNAIRDPNNVPIGTVLEIPKLDVFALKADPKKALREAKDWAFVILTGAFEDYQTQRPTLPSNHPDQDQ